VTVLMLVGKLKDGSDLFRSIHENACLATVAVQLCYFL
jgi:hypothetical protein